MDCDEGVNVQLVYLIFECQIQGMSVFIYVFINFENGYLYVLCFFDYEQFKDFSFQVEVWDVGSFQVLVGNVIVNIFIVDQNDNVFVIVVFFLGCNGILV